jgi:hypothetical protein
MRAAGRGAASRAVFCQRARRARQRFSPAVPAPRPLPGRGQPRPGRPTQATWPWASASLRDPAAGVGLRFGTALIPQDIETPSYAAIGGSQFSVVTPGNGMKWQIVEPTQGVYDYALRRAGPGRTHRSGASRPSRGWLAVSRRSGRRVPRSGLAVARGASARPVRAGSCRAVRSRGPRSRSRLRHPRARRPVR